MQFIQHCIIILDLYRRMINGGKTHYLRHIPEVYNKSHQSRWKGWGLADGARASCLFWSMKLMAWSLGCDQQARSISLVDHRASLGGMLIFPLTEQPSYTPLHTPMEHCPVPGHPPLLRAGKMASTAHTCVLAFRLCLDTGSPLSQGHKQRLARCDRWIAYLPLGGMTLGFALSGVPRSVGHVAHHGNLLSNEDFIASLHITVFHFPLCFQRSPPK